MDSEFHAGLHWWETSDLLWIVNLYLAIRILAGSKFKWMKKGVFGRSLATTCRARSLSLLRDCNKEARYAPCVVCISLLLTIRAKCLRTLLRQMHVLCKSPSKHSGSSDQKWFEIRLILIEMQIRRDMKRERYWLKFTNWHKLCHIVDSVPFFTSVRNSVFKCWIRSTAITYVHQIKTCMKSFRFVLLSKYFCLE